MRARHDSTRRKIKKAERKLIGGISCHFHIFCVEFRMVQNSSNGCNPSLVSTMCLLLGRDVYADS